MLYINNYSTFFPSQDTLCSQNKLDLFFKTKCIKNTKKFLKKKKFNVTKGIKNKTYTKSSDKNYRQANHDPYSDVRNNEAAHSTHDRKEEKYRQVRQVKSDDGW